MPQDITDLNIPIAVISADIHADDVRTIMLMVQMFALRNQGTATAEQQDAMETIEHLVGNGDAERLTNAN